MPTQVKFYWFPVGILLQIVVTHLVVLEQEGGLVLHHEVLGGLVASWELLLAGSQVWDLIHRLVELIIRNRKVFYLLAATWPVSIRFFLPGLMNYRRKPLMFLIRSAVLVPDPEHLLGVVVVARPCPILLLIIGLFASGRGIFLYRPRFFNVWGRHRIKSEVERWVVFRRHYFWIHRLIRWILTLWVLRLLVWSLLTETNNADVFVLWGPIACSFTLPHAWQQLTATRFQRILLFFVSLWTFSVNHRIIIFLVVCFVPCDLYKSLDLCSTAIQFW